MSPIERRTIAGVVSSLIIDVIRREKIMSDKDFEAKWPLLVYRSSSLLDEIKHSFRLIVFTKALLEAERERTNSHPRSLARPVALPVIVIFSFMPGPPEHDQFRPCLVHTSRTHGEKHSQSIFRHLDKF